MRAPEFWHSPPGLRAALLIPFACMWRAAGWRRNAVQPYRPPVPVVCVGNLVAGGSGKTPVVLSLLHLFTSHQIAAHALTRGYGGRLRGPVQVDPALHDAAAVGDEPLLLAAEASCWVARDRVAGGRAAAAAGAEVILLDDGFQNPGIAKDLSLLVVDAVYGFGNGRVIPAGPLREPVAAGLARADAIVLIGAGAAPDEVQSAGLPILHATLEPLDGKRFAGARVVAFAGIGRPGKFFASLRGLGAEVIVARSFPDHHRFSAADLARLRREAEHLSARLVTTAKDWARLPPQARERVAVLDVRIRWREPEAVSLLLTSLLARASDGHERSAAGR